MTQEDRNALLHQIKLKAILKGDKKKKKPFKKLDKLLTKEVFDKWDDRGFQWALGKYNDKPELIEKILTTGNSRARASTGGHYGNKITRFQFDRGLGDEDPLVRIAFCSRMHFKATKKQMRAGLMDDFRGVREAFAYRLVFELLTKNHKITL